MALASVDSKDGISYTGATSSTVGPFTILGGNYVFYGTAADTSAVLNVLCPDGSTYTPAYSETTSAYFQQVYLPPGTYEIVVVSASAQQGGLVKVPTRPVA